MVSDDYLTPIADGTTVSVFRALGGDILIDEMTSFTISGGTVYLRNEVRAIFNVTDSVMALTGDLSECGDAEADALVVAVDSLTNSKLLTAISAELICMSTEEIATGKKYIKVDDSGMFDDLVNKTVTILYTDAKSENDIERTQYKADLKTVALMFSDLIKGGAIANMDDTEAMMDELAGGTTIKKVIRDMKLPANLLYPFVKLGAKIFGRFNIDELSPLEQVKKSKIPTIFVHGDADDFVPMEMSKINYEACSAPMKKLVIIENAAHGLAFPVARDGYLKILREFFDPITSDTVKEEK